VQDAADDVFEPASRVVGPEWPDVSDLESPFARGRRDIEEVTGMADTIDGVVEASLRALEFREAAWDADERGRRCPDVSDLSDPALLTILRYDRSDLPPAASEAAETEAKHRGLLAGFIDRWLPWCVLGALVGSGSAIALELLTG
jgi:hypothetical protein